MSSVLKCPKCGGHIKSPVAAGHGVAHMATHSMRHSPPRSIGEAVVKIGIAAVSAIAAQAASDKVLGKCEHCGWKGALR